jgi:ribose 5-phosphate isomerase B
VPGIRAARCDNELEAKLARAHNDANVLCLGGRIIGPTLAEAIVEAFVTGGFEGGRHQRRIDKISALDGRWEKARE